MAEATGRVLLYSGGMDSLALTKLWRPDVMLHVQMGTGYERQEGRFLPEGTTITQFPLSRWERPDSRIIPARNLLLVAIAANYGSVVALGATAGDRVRDKDLRFAELASELLSHIWLPDHWTEGKDVRVELPLKALTKRQIVARWVAEGHDPGELAARSFSCYTPTSAGEPCGQCKPCFRKWVAFACNGIRVRPSSAEYIEREILPQIAAGTYGRREEETDILEAMARYR